MLSSKIFQSEGKVPQEAHPQKNPLILLNVIKQYYLLLKIPYCACLALKPPNLLFMKKNKREGFSVSKA